MTVAQEIFPAVLISCATSTRIRRCRSESVTHSRPCGSKASALGRAKSPGDDPKPPLSIALPNMQSSQLGGVGGTVLRRQIQRSAADSVKIYLEWMRDSLAAG